VRYRRRLLWGLVINSSGLDVDCSLTGRRSLDFLGYVVTITFLPISEK